MLEKYLDDEPLTEADLKKVIRIGTLAGHFVPVLTGSAFKNKGVQPMLDAVVDFLPSPLDIPPTEGTNLRGDEVVTREADDKAPFAALAFKIVTDPFGKLTYFRVYSGTINKGDEVYNSIKEKRERLGRILLMHANQREDLDVAKAGDIVAGLGFKDTTTGDTLCDRNDPVILERMEFPEPVIHVAIEPKTKSDQDKLGKALKSLSDEDPTFRVRTDEETGQTVISGMGELHLEVLVDRMQREFSRRGDRRQAAGRLPRDDHQAGRSRSSTGTSSRPAARASSPSSRSASSPTRAAATSSSTRSPAGASRASTSSRPTRASRPRSTRACSPATRRSTSRRRLVDGQYHDVDSSEMAFKIAGQAGVPQGRREGQAGAARADHVGRGRHARGVHGRRDGRPVEPARPHRRHGGPRQHAGRHGVRCRCRRCSDTVPTSVPAPRAGRRTRCSSTATSRCRRASHRRSSSGCAASDRRHLRPLTTHTPASNETLESACHEQGEV